MAKIKNSDGNIIFVGGKAVMNYVTGVVTQFENKVSEVIISSRGKFISKAVDVAEIVRKKFLKDVVIKEIKLDSQEFDNDKGKRVTVSTMDIVLKK